MNPKILAPILLGLAGALGLGYAAAQYKKKQAATPAPDATGGAGTTISGGTSGAGASSTPASSSLPSVTQPSDSTPFVVNPVVATPIITPTPIAPVVTSPVFNPQRLPTLTAPIGFALTSPVTGVFVPTSLNGRIPAITSGGTFSVTAKNVF